MKALLLGVGIACALGIGHLEATGYEGVGLMGLVGIFVVPGAGVAYLLWGILRRRPRAQQIGAAMVLGAMAGFFVAARIGNRQEQDSRARGDRLAVALDGYRTAHGDVPGSLQDLVPAFMPAVPPTCMGVFVQRPYFYARLGPSSYRLSFETQAWCVCERGAEGGWRVSD